MVGEPSPPPIHLAGYLAPEYRPNRQCSDTEIEKVISEYCKRRQPTRPFSHIVMDLHQEAMAFLEAAIDTPWGPPAMPELETITRNSTDHNNTLTIPRRWMGLRKAPNHRPSPKLTREASTSMEEIVFSTYLSNQPGAVIRPKSMCAPDTNYDQEPFNLSRCFTNFHSSDNFSSYDNVEDGRKDLPNQFENGNVIIRDEDHPGSSTTVFSNRTRNGSLLGASTTTATSAGQLQKHAPVEKTNKTRKTKSRRNPVQRAASRLYRAGAAESATYSECRDCVGPEFVVRSALPSKQYAISDAKTAVRKTVTVILLNGQKVDVLCNPNTTTAGQVFELIIQKELIEENFMLGLSALIAGDFVFLPSDTRICKAAVVPGTLQNVTLTLFLRVRFFLPSLRGVRGSQARHLLYLQLRRSILEHQLPCSFSQLIDLNGFALQAEFGDFNEREHGTRDYFLLEHYVPETMACAINDSTSLRYELTRAHKFKIGLDTERAEEDFILLAQTLPHYGGHFYTALWELFHVPFGLVASSVLPEATDRVHVASDAVATVRHTAEGYEERDQLAVQTGGLNEPVPNVR
ncbi:ferm domain (protein4.1-ezrin-radixin-moesin) family [Holotrichia oblita]|uniref:Ferm domain (Protein4.1-ezrin-radixin-moesin) family n=1 Tax=Holotrichia oblita TaxID=644536 RepID=A0ACB9SS99_HOLOL|nr:ferm domain (protein4.1-ezrin-radixin-moesin) family [Holotrichia oblita]